MKSIYLHDNIHNSLKLLATLEKKSLAGIVEELLKKGLKKKMADLPAATLQKLAAAGGSFAFLENPEEDIYSEQDGLSTH